MIWPSMVWRRSAQESTSKFADPRGPRVMSITRGPRSTAPTVPAVGDWGEVDDVGLLQPLPAATRATSTESVRNGDANRAVGDMLLFWLEVHRKGRCRPDGRAAN